MKNSLGILPLDSRPINSTQLIHFCEIFKINAEFFPNDQLGTRDNPAIFNDIFRWVNESELSEYILSLNSFCCGGLVQTRDLQETDIENAKTISNNLTKIKSKYCLVLPRVAPTVIDDISLNNHRSISNNEANLTPDPIKTELWKRFLQAIPQPECIVQEDTCDKSRISEAMLDLVNSQKPNFIYYANGGDELNYIAIARTFTENKPKHNFQIAFTYPESKNSICKFEHLTLMENINRISQYLNININDSSDQNLPTIFINNSRENNSDSIDNPISNLKQIGRIREALDHIQSTNIYVADIAQANGGDPNLWLALAESKKHIRSYSGWNTAMNSIGTLFATAVLDHLFPDHSTQSWLLLRILDDYIYQTLVRPRLYSIAAKKKWDVWSLPPTALKPLSESCKKLMYVEYQKLKSDNNWLPEIIDFSVDFPWKRLFELDIHF